VAQQRVLRKALARDPNARFETCLEFAEALIQTALDEESAG
jgi:hypothetical protein